MRAWILLPMMLMVACKAEPSFDERYDKAEQSIREKAEAIDTELEAKASQAPPATQPND